MAEKTLLEIAQDRFDKVLEAERETRDEMYDDIRFEAGDQWPDYIKDQREEDPDGPRPCLVVNMAKKHKNALLNDIRRNRPAMKVLPVDDKADKDTAEIFNGLMRHIQAVNDADIATDTAADFQITCGVGYFRIDTVVMDDSTNEQEITIGAMYNPFACYMDPHADHPAGADAKWCFVVDEVDKEEFLVEYPDSAGHSFREQDMSDSRHDQWFPSDETVRVAEYFYITTGNESDTWPHSKRCHWAKIAGNEILEERELTTFYIPIVRVLGEERRYENRRDYRGLIRDLKDPGRMYNYWTSANTEHIALAPKAPYLTPAEAIEGHEDEWKDANTAMKPYLPYNHVDGEGNPIPPPTRAQPIPVNNGIVQSMLQAQEDMRQVSGQSQAGFGERSNEQSGKAINARRMEQDSNTFHFVDNLARSMKHAGRIVLQMIPHIYDTPRVVRILGEDDEPDFAQFDPNLPQPMVEREDIAGKVQRIYNPTIGRYDVRVTVGPAYATRLEEGAERLSNVIQAAPEMMGIVGDLLFKAMDIPGSEDIAERLKAMLPPQLQQLEEQKKQGRAQGVQMMEQARQQMMAEIAPLVQQVQMEMQQAAQENQALQQQVDELTQQLKDKQLEAQVDVVEAEKKLEGEIARAEADVSVALIQAQACPDEEGEERREQGNGETEMGPAALALQAHQMMQETAAALAQRLEQATAMVASIPGAMAELEALVGQLGGAQEQLAGQVAAGEQRRREVSQVALDMLAGRITEEQAADAIARGTPLQ